MNAYWDELGRYAHLIYCQGDDQYFAMVRLHPAGKFLRRERLTGVRDTYLEQNCSADGESGMDILLEQHGVVVGRGSVQIELK